MRRLQTTYVAIMMTGKESESWLKDVNQLASKLRNTVGSNHRLIMGVLI